MDVRNSLSDDNSNKDFENPRQTTIATKMVMVVAITRAYLLKLSEDLQKENVLSEIKYTPLNKRLKITFSKKYNDKVAFEFLELTNGKTR